jgi:hypothetical protein
MAKDNVNANGLRSLYYALIHSHLNYCPIILNCLTKTKLSKLAKVQKKAIRIISKSTYNAHTAPIFQQLKILPLNLIIKNANLMFMHSIHNNYAPLSFQHVWHLNAARHGDRNLRNTDHYSLPHPRTDQFKRFPLYSLPLKWNKSEELSLYHNTTTFKHALRDKLFLELNADLMV